MLTKKKLDLIIATVIFLACISLSAFAYASLMKLEKPAQILLSSIQVGLKKYFILNNKACIGEYFTNLENQKNYFFHAKAEASGVYGKQHGLAKTRLSGQFNPLGQLFQGEVLIELGNFQFQVQATEINPLKLQISLRSTEKNLDYALSVPGPVEIKRSLNGTYHVEYPSFNQGLSTYLQAFGSGFLPQGINLELVEASASGISCQGTNRAEFDVASLVLQLQKSGSILNSFIPMTEE